MEKYTEFLNLFSKLFADVPFKLYSIRIFIDGSGGVDEIDLSKKTAFGISPENEVFGFETIEEALEILGGSEIHA